MKFKITQENTQIKYCLFVPLIYFFFLFLSVANVLYNYYACLS